MKTTNLYDPKAMIAINRSTHLFLTRRSKCCFVLLGLSIFLGAIPGFSQSPPDSTIKDDLAHASADINWPAGFSPKGAALFAHNSIVIKARCSTVWRNLIAARDWPAWYPNSQDVRIANDQSGALQQDSIFEWSTFGLPITSIVHEFTPDSRLAWFGKSKGLDAVFYHTWYLVPTADGCQVITEEVVQGPGAITFREKNPTGLHRSHETWLKDLQHLSEAE